MASDGKMPANVWIFRAKNYQGMKDVQQIEAVNAAPGDVPSNAEDIVATLPEAPDADAIEIESSSDSEVDKSDKK